LTTEFHILERCNQLLPKDSFFGFLERRGSKTVFEERGVGRGVPPAERVVEKVRWQTMPSQQ
tara:strand:- start:589 stop:774 length:186 start_codon:yes stop_codon:yes gene_type:complete